MGGCNSKKSQKLVRSETYKTPGSTIKRLFHVSKKLIGKGAFAKVFKGKSLANPKFKVAIKLYKHTPSNQTKSIENEVKVLSMLDHPNIAKFYGCINNSELRNNQARESLGEDTTYVITEYVKGMTLTNLLANNKYGLAEAEVAFIMNQLIKAINHCHANNVVHRDIKPDNIMVDEKLHVTLIDFGLSAIIQNDKLLKTKTGSPLFMAPEIAKEKYDNKVDIWSLGVLMYVLLSGRLPFSGKSPTEVLRQSLECDLALETTFGNKISPEALDLLQKMINVDPTSRPSCSKILKHDWFDMIRDDTTDEGTDRSGKSLLDSLVVFSCESRLKHFILVSLAKMSKDSQISELYQDFKKMDENGDGLISESELKNAFDKENKYVSLEQIRTIIKNLDFYGNKHITFSEFLVATLGDRIINDTRMVKAIFNQFDISEDGKIFKEDINREFNSMGLQISKSELKRIFQLHDPENTGYISYPKFLSSVMTA